MMRFCQRCGLPYTDGHNVGTWQCLLHPGRFDLRTRAYTCCGYRPEAMPLIGAVGGGCSRADHDLINMGEQLAEDRASTVVVARMYNAERASRILPEAILVPPLRLPDMDALRRVLGEHELPVELAQSIVLACLYDPHYWLAQSQQPKDWRPLLGLMASVARARDRDLYAKDAFRDPLRRAEGLTTETLPDVLSELMAESQQQRDRRKTPSQMFFDEYADQWPMPKLALVYRVSWDRPHPTALSAISLYNTTLEQTKISLFSGPPVVTPRAW